MLFTCPANLILLDMIIFIISCENYIYEARRYELYLVSCYLIIFTSKYSHKRPISEHVKFICSRFMKYCFVQRRFSTDRLHGVGKCVSRKDFIVYVNALSSIHFKIQRKADEDSDQLTGSQRTQGKRN